MSSVYDRALKLIKIRPHHSEELAKKLLMRGFNREEITDAIQKLTDEKLLDNALFAQIYLDSLIRHKTLGYYGIKAKLMRRGIAGKEAEELLRENFSVEQETEIAQRVIVRAAADKMKLAQKLQRKGFRSEVISTVINKKQS